MWKTPERPGGFPTCDITGWEDKRERAGGFKVVCGIEVKKRSGSKDSVDNPSSVRVSVFSWITVLPLWSPIWSWAGSSAVTSLLNLWGGHLFVKEVFIPVFIYLFIFTIVFVMAYD